MEPAEFLSVNQRERSSDERLVVFHGFDRRNFDQRGDCRQKLAGGAIIAVAGQPVAVLVLRCCGLTVSRRARIGMLVAMLMLVTMTVFAQP